jgi:hypothetical protein
MQQTQLGFQTRYYTVTAAPYGAGLAKHHRAAAVEVVLTEVAMWVAEAKRPSCLALVG